MVGWGGLVCEGWCAGMRGMDVVVVGSMVVGDVVVESPLVKVALWAGHSVIAAVVLVVFVVVKANGGWSSSCVCYCCGFCVVTGVVGVGSGCPGLWVHLGLGVAL